MIVHNRVDCQHTSRRRSTVVIIPYEESLHVQSITVEDDEEIARLIVDPSDDLLNVIPTLLVRSVLLNAYHEPNTRKQPNIRATRLAMACGLLSKRFRGNVVVALGPNHSRSCMSLNDIAPAACGSYDLRPCILGFLGYSSAPQWLVNACQENYLDDAVLKRFSAAMKSTIEPTSMVVNETISSTELRRPNGVIEVPISPNISTLAPTKVPLCLECRRPVFQLCPECEGAYFCSKFCRIEGWSHDCICPTWRLYTERRSLLSAFPDLGQWCQRLTGRECQLSDQPYLEYLTKELGVQLDTNSWWHTEQGGWSGGSSVCALSINYGSLKIRRTFGEGFKPIHDIPVERFLGKEDWYYCRLPTKNDVGIFRISSWGQYYRLRNISINSPVALILTYPLTLYYAILMYGEVPCTVAKILKRPLRIHIVGVEKELNFLDIFKEVSFLLGRDFFLELVFVVRDDMLPPLLKSLSTSGKEFNFALTCSLQISIVGGVYGNSLSPHFDCGNGPPDMIMAFNAGLYAYESWRCVVTFLDEYRSVIGVFSDYNEFSGVQCASLGGESCRNSLRINPFRQPRAMPVFSMNLPQFSNGFLYVFNSQVLPVDED